MTDEAIYWFDTHDNVWRSRRHVPLTWAEGWKVHGHGLFWGVALPVAVLLLGLLAANLFLPGGAWAS